MQFCILLIYSAIFLKIFTCQYTYKSNEILSRKKRYLSFPEGSNLIMTGSAIKAVMLMVPPGFLTLLEMDVLFKLPSAVVKKKFKKGFYHFRHRRDVFKEISRAIEMFGFDGKSCIKKAFCEAKQLSPFEENSLFQQLIVTIFSSQKYDKNLNKDCEENLQKCDFSLLKTILYHIYDYEI